jgi:hypothetical protein
VSVEAYLLYRIICFSFKKIILAAERLNLSADISKSVKMGDQGVSITMLSDENGMIGRECLECKQYFKLKPGTGLPTDYIHCPYCEYEGKADTFWTPAQLEYIHSMVFQQVFNPALKKINKSFRELERNTRNSLIQFKVKTTGDFHLSIKYYSEEELETQLTCNNCNLEFAIYGVFSRCPDCSQINAFLIYEKSLETIKNKLNIFSKPEIPNDILEISLSSILTSAISAFDGLGKELRKRKPSLYPAKPQNLFQNLKALNEGLNNLVSENHGNYEGLFKLFQVRHLYEHNMGVVDNDFIKKVPTHENLLGRKYKLTVAELNEYIDWMSELGKIIKRHFEEN